TRRTASGRPPAPDRTCPASDVSARTSSAARATANRRHMRSQRCLLSTSTPSMPKATARYTPTSPTSSIPLSALPSSDVRGMLLLPRCSTATKLTCLCLLVTHVLIIIVARPTTSRDPLPTALVPPGAAQPSHHDHD